MKDALQQAWDMAPALAKRLEEGEQAAKAEMAALRKDAERYRWLRDKGSATWTPFTRQWDMNAEHCDAAIDNEMATHGLFGAA